MVASSFGTQLLWQDAAGAQGAQCAPGQTYSSLLGVCVEECWVDEGFDPATGTCVPLIPREPALPSVVPYEPEPPKTVVQMPFVWPAEPNDTPDTPIPEPTVAPEPTPVPEPVAPVNDSGAAPVAATQPSSGTPEEPEPEASDPQDSGSAESTESEAAEETTDLDLNPNHPCVEAGLVPEGVTTNSELLDYAYLPGTNECVALEEFNDRLASFEEAAGAERDALEELRSATEAMSELQDDFEEVEARLVEARAAYRDAYENATEASTLVKETRQKLIETSERLENKRIEFAKKAVDSYMGGGDQEMIASLVPSLDSETTLGATLSYAEAVLNDRDEAIETMETLQAELAAQERKYEEQKAKAEVQLDIAHATKVEWEDTLADRQELIDAMDEDIAVADALVSQFRDDKFETAHSIGVFSVESKKVEEILAEAEAKIEVGEPIPEPVRDYIAPVDPPTYGSLFGPRLHPILGVMRNHDGLDFRADHGQSIYATRGGTVVHADVMGGYGNTVLIDHGNGTASLYAHQSSMAVSYGDTVEQGQVIGYIGSTGMSTGPHLHFEIREGGAPVDPLPYLGL